ncbi:hypothetical protein, partial [Xanthomonas euvesicatoria]
SGLAAWPEVTKGAPDPIYEVRLGFRHIALAERCLSNMVLKTVSENDDRAANRFTVVVLLHEWRHDLCDGVDAKPYPITTLGKGDRPRVRFIRLCIDK